MPISWPIEMAAMETFDQRLGGFVRPRVSPGKFNPSLLPEPEGANVFVESVFAQAQRDLDRAHVARLRQHAPHRQQAVRLRVADAHAVVDDRSHLAVEHFVRVREFLFQRRRNRHQLERRSGLVA